MTTAIKNISEEFSKGNFQFAFNHFSDNIQWNIVGDKIINGKENVIEFCNKMTTEMPSSQLTNTNTVIENNSIVIEGICNYKNDENKPARVHYCDVYRFDKEKINSITSYCITEILKS